MYLTVLTIHSWLRWATLVMAVGATLNALRPAEAGATKPPGRWLDSLFMFAVDLQMLAGLVLYFGLSPATTAAMNNIGAAVRNPGESCILPRNADAAMAHHQHEEPRLALGEAAVDDRLDAFLLRHRQSSSARPPLRPPRRPAPLVERRKLNPR